MATAQKSADPIFRRLERLPQVMTQAQRQVADEAGRAFQASTEKRIRAAAGGDGVLSGMTRTTGGRSKGKPRPMGAFYRVEQRPTGYQAFVKATGPVHLIEKDVPRHIVVSRHAKGADYTRTNKAGKQIKGRSTRESRQASVALGLGAAGGGRRAVLNLGGGVFRRWTIASSKGREPWRQGVKEATPQLAAIQTRVQRAAIGSALR